MSQNSQNRRNFLKSAAVGGAAMGVGATGVTNVAQAQAKKNPLSPTNMNQNPGYLFFNFFTLYSITSSMSTPMARHIFIKYQAISPSSLTM